MYAIISTTPSGERKVLNTQNGVVSVLDGNASQSLCFQGAELCNHPEFSFVGDFYKRIVKMAVLGDNHGYVWTEIVDVLRRVAQFVDDFAVPDRVSFFHCKAVHYADVSFIRLSSVRVHGIRQDYLYAVSPSGIQHYSNVPYRLYELSLPQPCEKGYSFAVMSTDSLEYQDIVVDKNLKAISVVDKVLFSEDDDS